MLAETLYQNVSVPETEESLTKELLGLSEDPGHPLHLCAGLFIHEVRGLWKRFNEDFNSAEVILSLSTLRYVVEKNVEVGRPITGQDLLDTFSYINTDLKVPYDFEFKSVEQFLCVRTLVDNSIIYGDCEVKVDFNENTIQVIDFNNKPWKEGYWKEVQTAYECGLSWDPNVRFKQANRGKAIVATILGIRNLPNLEEIILEVRKGIRLRIS